MADKGRIALGMSGGVDSSVAAALLRRDGWDVVGVTCVFTPDGGHAVQDARLACERLGIPHASVDCCEEFEKRVIAPFVDDYAAGLTPSPCVGCNASAKLPFLLEAADGMGCTHVATGHYANVVAVGDGRFAIERAVDEAKDQSYMLAMLTQEQLARLVLPLGGVSKTQVRAMASELGMQELADKPESQDICFAPNGYRALLAEYGVCAPAGPIVLDSVVVGEHTGLVDYTVGQRKGIGVAGPEPYYVLAKDAAANSLLIGTSAQAKVSGVAVSGFNMQAIADFANPMEAMVKLRYRSRACPCIMEFDGKSRVIAKLIEPQQATAPGQYAVFYRGSTVIGGGVIEEVF
ncbi:MAG: tRNA 2-thiouridine(34) synthase MnmA [Eggerthellaceae bacterium]|nr:tRNA 2-thiouridine(34) synthase MnmA [Eggerthellaceae bacterium]